MEYEPNYLAAERRRDKEDQTVSKSGVAESNFRDYESSEGDLSLSSHVSVNQSQGANTTTTDRVSTVSVEPRRTSGENAPSTSKKTPPPQESGTPQRPSRAQSTQTPPTSSSRAESKNPQKHRRLLCNQSESLK
ncbi:hypothetical protein ANCCAN_28271, partial [Ancylostoma caninum]